MAAALQQPSDIPVSLASERAVLGEGWGSDDGDCEEKRSDDSLHDGSPYGDWQISHHDQIGAGAEKT